MINIRRCFRLTKLLIAAIFLNFTNIQAQPSQNRFKAGVAGGFHLSQIDGDNQQGYHKLGYLIGINGGFQVKNQFDITTELYLNSRGAKPNPRQTFFSKEELKININMQLAEMMAIGHVRFDPSSDMSFYRQAFQFGVAYGKVLKSDITVIKDDKNQTGIETEMKKGLKKTDLGLVLGWSWYLTPRFGVTARHTFSLLPIYSNEIVGTDKSNYFKLRPYFLSLNVFYNFISPKMDLKKNKKKEKDKLSKLEEI